MSIIRFDTVFKVKWRNLEHFFDLIDNCHMIRAMQTYHGKDLVCVSVLHEIALQSLWSKLQY